MTKGFALALVAILCLAGQSPADEVVPTEPTPVEAKVESILDGPTPPVFLEPTATAFPERWWVSTDYLLGWVRGSLLQPLVTTSPSGTPLNAAGVLGKNGTSILFGNGNFNNDMRSGFKIGAGGWFDAERTFGMDIGFFMLESQNTLFSAASQGDTILARPFFNAVSFLQDSQVVAFPGVATGSIAASLRSNNLYSGHVDFQEVFLEDAGYRLEAIVGYRYLRFDERLAVIQDLTSPGTGVLAKGTTIQTLDNFTAHNEFNGADLGLRAQLLGQRWSLDLMVKLGAGNIHREVPITGLTQTTVPGAAAPVTRAGGMLALASNAGQNASDDWIVIPELAANLGWNLTSNIRLRLGYDVLFWSNVARASDQVSLVINPHLFPPLKGDLIPFTPLFSLVKSDMWVQAVNLGLEFRY